MKNYIKLFLYSFIFSVSIYLFNCLCNIYDISILHRNLIIFLNMFANVSFMLLFFHFDNERKSALSNKAD